MARGKIVLGQEMLRRLLHLPDDYEIQAVYADTASDTAVLIVTADEIPEPSEASNFQPERIALWWEQRSFDGQTWLRVKPEAPYRGSLAEIFVDAEQAPE